MRIAGGILTIIAGCLGIGFGTLMVMFKEIGEFFGEELAMAPWEVVEFVRFYAMLIAIGIVALIGGIFALRRRCWRFALAGSILAIFCGGPVGILGTIFIAKRKGEFA